MRSRFHRFNWLGEALLGLIYPPSVSCPLCGKPGSFHPAREAVCGRCQTAIAELQAGLLCCRCCGRFFLQTERTIVAAADWYCPGCQKSRPGFDFARAVGPYAGILREAIHKFKYLGKLSLAEPLGKLMAAAIREEFLPAVAAASQSGGGKTGGSVVGAAGATRDAKAGVTRDGAVDPAESATAGAAGAVGVRDATTGAARGGAACVVPVPLHPQRLGERGFNQAELLAEIVAQELKLEFAPGMLARGKHTPSQTQLSREERQLNLQGAFVLGRGHGDSGLLKPASLTKPAVLIVDDVLTTGSTGAECARVLREAVSGPIVLVTTATGGNFKPA